jgi:hypothetical protein
MVTGFPSAPARTTETDLFLTAPMVTPSSVNKATELAWSMAPRSISSWVSSILTLLRQTVCDSPGDCARRRLMLLHTRCRAGSSGSIQPCLRFQYCFHGSKRFSQPGGIGL